MHNCAAKSVDMAVAAAGVASILRNDLIIDFSEQQRCHSDFGEQDHGLPRTPVAMLSFARDDRPQKSMVCSTDYDVPLCLTTSTEQCECFTTLWETLPRKSRSTRERSRDPTTIRSAFHVLA